MNPLAARSAARRCSGPRSAITGSTRSGDEGTCGYEANAGIYEEVRMKLTGHSSKPVHHGYTHLELETLKSAVTALPLFTPRQPEPA